MDMKKYFAAVVISAAASVFAGTDYDLDSVSAWKRSANITQSGDHLIVKGRTFMESRKLFDIDPSKIYKLELEAKNLTDVPARIYFGFEMYDADGKRKIRRENIQIVHGTFCTVVKDVKKGDSAVFVDGGAAKWTNKKGTVIAIDAQKDCSDLPNFKLLFGSIKSIEKTAEGYKVTFNGGCPYAIAAGTGLRLHRAGGLMYTGGAAKLTGGKFTEMKGKVTGQLSRPGFEYHIWSKYAKKASVIILANWGSNSEVEFKDIELEIDDKK